MGPREAWARGSDFRTAGRVLSRARRHALPGFLPCFGAKEGLVVSWIRQDGAAGTTQGPLTPEDLERMRAEREARQASS